MFCPVQNVVIAVSKGKREACSAAARTVKTCIICNPGAGNVDVARVTSTRARYFINVSAGHEPAVFEVLPRALQFLAGSNAT